MLVGNKEWLSAGPGHAGTCMACWEVPLDTLREGDYIRTFLIAKNRSHLSLA